MSRLLVAQRALTVPGWAKNALWRSARAVPSLDLRFADNKSLVDAVTGASLVTFTRASSGTYVDSAGVLQTAATDVPRFDHNPTTGESLGLLVEEQRTNSVTNNTMVGAVAGTPGTNPTGWTFATAQSNGLTISIVGTGVESGINYIDYRFNGTTVASPNACAFGFTNAAAATSQTWTNSLYWKLASGATTGATGWQLGIIENTAVGAFVTGAFYTQTTPTSAALITQRPTATRTLSGGVTVGQVSHTMNITVAGNTAIDFTIRIGPPQLEQGAFATSPILTSTAAATRSADVASITGTAFSGWYRQDEGTVFASAVTNARHGGINSFPRIASVSDGTNNNLMETYYRVLSSYTDVGYSVINTGTTQASFDTNDNRNGQNVALGYASNNFPLAVGGTVVATDTSGTVPTVSRLALGARGDGGLLLNGTIRRLVYWGQRLPNNVLQAITQ